MDAIDEVSFYVEFGPVKATYASFYSRSEGLSHVLSQPPDFKRSSIVGILPGNGSHVYRLRIKCSSRGARCRIEGTGDRRRHGRHPWGIGGRIIGRDIGSGRGARVGCRKPIQRGRASRQEEDGQGAAFCQEKAQAAEVVSKDQQMSGDRNRICGNLLLALLHRPGHA